MSDERAAKRTRLVLCMVALGISFANGWLLNYSAFPLFDSVFYWTREISAVIGGLVLGAVALASFWMPGLLAGHRLHASMAVCMALGTAIMALGIVLDSAACLVFGACLATVGLKLSNIIVGISLVGVETRKLGIGIAVAYAVSYAFRGVFSILPQDVNFALFCLLPFLATVMAGPYAALLLNKLDGEESPAESALLTPSSMLPFGHQVFLTLLVFRFVYGFTLAFDEIGRTPSFVEVALPLFCAIAVIVVLMGTPLKPDALFRLTILCATAGFLLLPQAFSTAPFVASVLLTLSSGCFEILMFFVLIELGSRNESAALPMLAWGNAMASWGTLLGANLGRVTGSLSVDDSFVLAVSALIVFGMMVYVVLGQKAFSFADAIAGVTHPSPITAKKGEAESGDMAQRCLSIGRRCGLTAREQEIFEYLSRGRNIRFIQSELVVSYNTVKTHVSHIYAKLGVHSHQELIDLVEGER